MTSKVGLLQSRFGHGGFGIKEAGELRDQGFSPVEEVCDLGFCRFLFGGGLRWDVGYLRILGVGVEESFGL